MTCWHASFQRRRLTLGDFSAEQLIETLAETVGEAQTKKHADPLHDVEIEVIIDTRGDVEASKLVKTWADTVIKVDTRKVEDTLRQLEADALINTPGDALA